MQRDLQLTWVAICCLNFGMGMYSAVFYNFATEVIHISPVQLGRLEAIRELPGFLVVVTAALTMSIAEPLLASFALYLVTIGLGAYAWVNGIHSLMFWSFTWSVGLHMWFPLQSSLVLGMSEKGGEGKRLGQSASIASFGTVLGMCTVLFVGHAISYGAWFILGSMGFAIAATIFLFVRRNLVYEVKPRLIWRREYTLYYALTFLEGCRKQVFMTFAIYALTREYGTPLKIVAALMVLNGIVNTVGAPIVGKLIDRIGERRILMVSYASLILVFIGYATIHHSHILYVLYCLDNLFFLSSPCLTTYIKKIARPEDLMPTLSMGVTVNHAAAVFVPLVGGALWAKLGYPVTFFGGAGVVAVSVILAARLSVPKRQSPA